MFDTNKVIVDNDAKLRVSLYKIRQEVPYYVGKLQFPGKLELQRGATFMVFTSEEESEELQIGPMDPSKRSKNVRSGSAIRPPGKIVIDLHESRDGRGQLFYVGEALAPAQIDCFHGIFFTIMLNDSQQEVQISVLDHNLSRKRRRYSDDSGEYEATEDYGT